jgi:hypothetical protein
MLSQFKRAFYIEQLRLLGIKQVEGKPVQELSDHELKYALTMARLKAGA